MTMSKQKKNQTIDANALPTPLALAWQAYQQESEPFRKVHRLIDAIEVFVKLHTVAVVSQYVRRDDVSPTIRALLAAGLKTPSLGIWWQFAREVTRALEEEGAGEIYPQSRRSLIKKGQLFKAMEGQNNLIAFRNGYAHGATPPSDRCKQDMQRYGAILEKLIASAEYLVSTRLLTITSEGEALAAVGAETAGMERPQETGTGRCYLLSEAGELLSLHPLLSYNEAEGCFYFYNDLRTRVASFLNYDQCLYWRDKDLREELLNIYPIDQWRQTGKDVDEFVDRIEALTDVFKGRRPQLAELAGFLEQSRGFLMVWGSPGVGKSALIARAAQILDWAPGLREQVYPDLPQVDAKLSLIPYFIRRGATSGGAEYMLSNLNQRLEMVRSTGIPLGGSVLEQAERLGRRISAVASKLGENQRLVLFIDGLDEGSDAEGMLEHLPKDVPEKVLVIYASREHPRVQDVVYHNLDREHRQQMTLGGLQEAEVRAMLYEHVNKYKLESQYVEQVAEKSEGNPLYLKLLCDGLDEGGYHLNDSVSLPTKIEDLYYGLIKRFGVVEGCLDLLCLLAAARDYLSPAAIASITGRDSGYVISKMIYTCAEVLFENPFTEDIDDYQLFHESLREYLKDHHHHEVVRWDERLAEWCADWRSLRGEMKVYALRYGLEHAMNKYLRVAEEGGDATTLADEMFEWFEDEEFREAVFQFCGNDGPIRAAVKMLHPLLVERDEDGSEVDRIVVYARMMHGEGLRLYSKQLESIDKLSPAKKGDMERLADLAMMGDTPRQRVMLVLRALAKGKPSKLPAVLTSRVDTWLEAAASESLNQLWQETTGR